MRRRKRNIRGVSAESTGFFAFQDIIMAVIAFVLLNILFQITLVRGIVSDGSTAKGSGAPVPKDIEKLEAELEALKSQVVKLESSIATRTTESPMDPRVSVEEAQRRNETLRVQVEDLEQKLRVLPREDRSNPVADAVADIDNQIAKKKKELERSIESEVKVDQAVDQAEREVAIAQQTLTNLQQQGQRIWLLPERDEQGRDPIIGVVNQTHVEWYRSGDDAPRWVDDADRVRSPDFVLDNCPSSSFFVVLYFRPSGSEHFEFMTEAFRNRGYAIGYDTLMEQQAIHFGETIR